MITFDVVEAYTLLKPLVIFTVGIALYSIFVFIFYRFLARENILKLNLRQYNRVKHKFTRKFFGIILYFVEYIVLFPIFILLWSGIMTALLLFLSKNRDVQNILLFQWQLLAQLE